MVTLLTPIEILVVAVVQPALDSLEIVGQPAVSTVADV
jgi:hypothetical protein